MSVCKVELSYRLNTAAVIVCYFTSLGNILLHVEVFPGEGSLQKPPIHPHAIKVSILIGMADLNTVIYGISGNALGYKTFRGKNSATLHFGGPSALHNLQLDQALNLHVR